MPTRLTFVGHATVLIEMDGIRVLTDPALTSWIGPLRRRPTRMDPEWTQEVDAVLLSHIHHDHLHLPSLARVDPDARLVTPAGTGDFLRAAGFRNIQEVLPDDEITIGSVGVRVVSAEHDAGRPGSRLQVKPQGFVLDGSNTIYFPGDTASFPDLSDVTDTVDLALVPIWGWGPTLGPGHLDPESAADALGSLQPRLAVPIHWGTYFPVGLPWRRRFALSEAPHIFQRLARSTAPDVDVRVIEPGAELTLP